jgi:hypothetical protein
VNVDPGFSLALDKLPGFFNFEKNKMITDATKQEQVGYLKSSFRITPGTLYLTTTHLIFRTKQIGLANGGLLGLLSSRLQRKEVTGFDIDLENINEIKQGSFGRAKNILEVTDKKNNSYRILVKDYAEWMKVLKKTEG